MNCGINWDLSELSFRSHQKEQALGLALHILRINPPPRIVCRYVLYTWTIRVVVFEPQCTVVSDTTQPTVHKYYCSYCSNFPGQIEHLIPVIPFMHDGLGSHGLIYCQI